MGGLDRLGGVRRAGGGEQGLAIEGDGPARRCGLRAERRGEPGHEGAEGSLEALGVEQAEDAAERIVAGHAVFEGEDGLEKIGLLDTEGGDLDAALRTAQRRGQRDEKNVAEINARRPHRILFTLCR